MKNMMISILFISIFLIPSQSLALSCAEPLAPAVAFEEYDAVVIGSVKGIESTGGAKKLTVEVEKSFKGVDVNKITVYEDMTWGESQEGARYLFFLDKEGEKWFNPLCSSTTGKTDLAAEHFADQKEIPLQDVESFNSESDNPLAIVMISALMLGIVAAIIWILSAWKRKNA